MHDLGNVNEAEYNLRNRMHLNDLKRFKVEELKGRKSNRSFDKEESTRVSSIVDTSMKGSIKEMWRRGSTSPMHSIGKSVNKNKHTPFKIF